MFYMFVKKRVPPRVLEPMHSTFARAGKRTGVQSSTGSCDAKTRYTVSQWEKKEKGKQCEDNRRDDQKTKTTQNYL